MRGGACPAPQAAARRRARAGPIGQHRPGTLRPLRACPPSRCGHGAFCTPRCCRCPYHMPAPLHHSQHQRRLTPRPARAPCARPHARTLYTRGRPLGSHGVAWRRAPRSAASAAVSVSWLRARRRADEHLAASAQAWRGSGRALGAATSGPPVGTGRTLSHDASGQGARLAPRWSEVPVRVRATPQSDPALELVLVVAAWRCERPLPPLRRASRPSLRLRRRRAPATAASALSETASDAAAVTGVPSRERGRPPPPARLVRTFGFRANSAISLRNYRATPQTVPPSTRSIPCY